VISADPAAVRATVGAVLADRAARDPGRPYLECDRVVLGYAEADDRDAPLPPGQVGEIVYRRHEPHTIWSSWRKSIRTSVPAIIIARIV
jgi:hypothetical protein